MAEDIAAGSVWGSCQRFSLVQRLTRRPGRPPLADSRSLPRAGGRPATTSVIEEIEYHALLVDLPAALAQQVLRHSADIRAGRCRRRPVLPTDPADAPPNKAKDADEAHPEIVAAGPSSAPLVALLDGPGIENHGCLKRTPAGGRSGRPCSGLSRRKEVSRDSDGIPGSFTGNLTDNATPSDRELYVRPILTPSRPERKSKACPKTSSGWSLVHRA